MESSTSATTRRRFLGAAAGVTGAFAMGVIDPVRAEAAANNRRSFIASKFALELGSGNFQGFLQSADGGDAYADVVVEPVGADHIQHKHLAGVKYDDITLESGFGLEPDLYSWIAGMFNGQATRRNGALIGTDSNGKTIARREFQDALLGSVTIPSCDASSQNTGFLQVTAAAEHVQDGTLGGSLKSGTQKTKSWLRSNFNLKIDGLDTTRVSAIDAITVTQTLDENSIGAERNFGRSPLFVGVSDLIVRFSVISLPSWKKWFEASLTDGGSKDEKNGTLTLLASDLKTEFAVLNLHGLGIHRLDPDPEPDSTESFARARADMYIEQITVAKLGSFTPAT